MNSIKISAIILSFAILLFSIILGGQQINKNIKESIEANFREEINSLKIKINKQSELINSIIAVNNKSNGNDEKENKPANLPEQSNQSTANSQEFEYVKENGGITITRYKGSKTSVQIPNKIDQLNVLKIAENAFADTKVKSVVLPSHCKEIDWFAFNGCFALSTIYISAKVTNIGYGAFDGCSKSLTIYCEENSFAEDYAKSFGISYTNFN